MELTFVRADHEVTGSCHHLHVNGHHLLVDYGMEQGRNRYENIPLPVGPADIEIVFVTHAHIDHTGMLPELYAKGFRGRILCTHATKELSDTMLRDSAHIQMQESESENRRSARRGGPVLPPAEPLYTMQDAMNVLTLFESHPYGEIIDVCDGVRARFTDIGHLLGSASIELWLTENGQTRTIVFSGDIGNTDQPLLRDPQPTARADYVVMESTYGSRYHERPADGGKYDAPTGSGGSSIPVSGSDTAPGTDDAARQSAAAEETEVAGNGCTDFSSGSGQRSAPPASSSRQIAQLADVIRDTLRRGGNIVIPAFAVGRTQSLLYFIKQIRLRNLLPEFPDFPVYVDSPMAVAATNIFENNEIECYDEEAQEMIAQGINPISFPGLHLSITADESKAINTDPEPKVILSASGMCDAGRIKYHLKFNIANPNSTVLFVGYQSEGTLGRRLLDGAQKVKIFGTDYAVRARIAQMDGMSGHADKAGLLAWLQAFEEKPRQVFLVHGDDEAICPFEKCLADEYGYKVLAPYSGTQYDLLGGRFIRIAKPVPAGKKRAESPEAAPGKKASAADSYTKLKIAEKRLAEVIDGAAGLPNKDLAAFTRALNDLCSRYRVDK